MKASVLHVSSKIMLAAPFEHDVHEAVKVKCSL